MIHFSLWPQIQRLSDWTRSVRISDSKRLNWCPQKSLCSSSFIGKVIMKNTVLLATLLAAFALTACGKKEEMPVAPAEPAAAVAPAVEAAKEAGAATVDAAKEAGAATVEAAKDAAAVTTDAAKEAAAATTDAAKEAADKAAEAAKAAVAPKQ
jgi:hypothetical protein